MIKHLLIQTKTGIAARCGAKSYNLTLLKSDVTCKSCYNLFSGNRSHQYTIYKFGNVANLPQEKIYGIREKRKKAVPNNQ